MSINRAGRFLAIIGAAVGVAHIANAGYITVDLSSYVDTSYGGLINAGSGQYPTGVGTGLTGVPFNIANAGAVISNGYSLNYWGGLGSVNASGGNDHGTTLKVTGLSIANVTNAYTLINSTFGAVGDNPTTVTFISTGGSLTFNLIEGTDMRDYNDDGFVNTTTSPNTTEWFDNGGAFDGSSSNQHLDQQTFDLSSLLGNITEVDVTENPVVVVDPITGAILPGGSADGEDTIFSGLAFLASAPTTTVPEPTSLAILAGGLISLGFARRRKQT